MTASGYEVKQVTKVKILGYIIQSNIKNNSQINKLTSNLNNRIYGIKTLSNKTSKKTREILVKSIVIGKLNYTLPLLINSTKSQLQKLNTIINRCGKTIMGNPCLRWTSARILDKCNLTNIWHMLLEQGLNFIHKIQIEKEPKSIFSLYQNTQRHKRHQTKIIPIYTPKTKSMKNFIFYKFSEIHTTLNPHLQHLPIKSFKIEIKQHIIQTHTTNNIHSTIIPDSDHTDSE